MKLDLPIQVNLPAKTIVRAMLEQCLKAIPEADDAPIAAEPRHHLPAIGADYEGGLYAGLTLHNGQPHALVLLPTEGEDLTWKKAQAFAKDAGGELPSRIDQLVLSQNLKREFKDAWYWSGEPYVSGSAWYQTFTSGFQLYLTQDYKCRARAVRRIPIE